MAYLTQRGIGAYDPVGDWRWEYYPPPYDFLAPADSHAVPAPILFPASAGRTAGRGIGGCGCGGSCGGCGGHSHGIGLFDSTDFATWGVAEWSVIAGGVYLLFSLWGDTKRGASRVSRTVSKTRSGARRRAKAVGDLF